MLRKSTKEARTNNNNRRNISLNPALAVPSPDFHFPATLQWNNVEFLPKMRVGDTVFVCKEEKDGVPCGFALCDDCKLKCSSERGASCSRGGASTASNSLTEDQKNLLTGCHSNYSRLQPHYYFFPLKCQTRILVWHLKGTFLLTRNRIQKAKSLQVDL